MASQMLPLLIFASFVVSTAAFSTTPLNKIMRIHQNENEFATTSLHSISTSGENKLPSPSTCTFKHVKAVIFDIDGTLADSGKLGFDATNVVLKNNNIATITLPEYLEGCRYTTPIRLARHAGLTEEIAEFRSVGEKLGREFDDYYVNLVSMETAPFYPGILQLIENLPSNVALGALTNAAGRYAHAVLKANSQYAASLPESKFESPESLYNRFGSILGADEVPKPKPFGDGLLKVCEEIGIAPSDCVYIGDASSDGMAAKAAGMPSIGVTWGANTEESLVAANIFANICNEVQELRSLVPQTDAT